MIITTTIPNSTLLISVFGFTVFFAWLANRRREQLGLETFAAELQRQVEG